MSEFPSFLRLNNIPLHVYRFCLAIHPSVDTWVASTLLWIIQLWTWVYKYLWDPALNSFVYIPRHELAGLYGNFMFNFLRNHHTVIHSNCPVLNSQKQLKRVPISTSSLPLVISWFFIVAVIMGERWWGLSNKSQLRGVFYSEAQSAPQFLHYWGPVLFLPMPFCPETTMRSPHTTTKSNPHSPQLEKACAQQWRPNTTKKINKVQKKF